MPLRDVPLPPPPTGIPRTVRDFLAEADRRVCRFQMSTRVPAFVPSDYPGAYAVLRELAGGTLTRGTRFCEWGSGHGVVACLAAMLDYEACGIEVAGELVTAARELADDFDLPVEFTRGSFVPRDAETRVASAGEYAWLTTDGDDAYEDLGLDPDDFDVIFAYPWPDEEVVTADLFERAAGVGALLVTYGADGFRVRRKVAGKKRRA